MKFGFPNLVYRTPGAHFGPKGKTYDYLSVTTRQEAENAFSDGWFPTLEAAVGGDLPEIEIVDDEEAKPKVEEDSEPEAAPVAATRAELEEQAKALGVKFTKATTDAQLAAAINKVVGG